MFRYYASTLYSCFNRKTDKACGRCFMLTSTVLQSIISQLTAGIFYTGFLVGYGINIVNIGIITLMPYLANLLGIFAPVLLERFPKRKGILACCRVMYYTINIAGLTLLPKLVQGNTQRVIGMMCIVFTANAFNSVAVAGYSAWYMNFLPDDIRAQYFSAEQFLSSLIPGVMLLASGAITDALSGTPYQFTIIIILRWIAYAVAVIDIVIVCLPKEYPYQESRERPRITDLFTYPLHEPRFLRTMIIVFIWQFASLMYSSALVVYLLKTVGVSYLFYNFIIAVYSLFFIFFSAYWQRLIARRSWLLTYAVTLLIRIPAQAAFAFVSPLNYIWLMLAVRFPQHFVGVGQNVCYANMQYLNMPKEHRTCFTAFYQLVSNTGSLLGLMTGTAFVAATADVSFNILGITISNVPMLILFDSALELVIAVYVLIFRKKLTPPTAENI